MYDSVEMAKYIAAYWNEKRVDVNMTKIQKLLYIAYGVWLAVYGERLVDEHPQAWPYGPVFPKTRNALLKAELNNISFDNDVSDNLKSNESLKDLFMKVFNSFGLWTANMLSNWSHKKDSPWDIIMSQPEFVWSMEIPDNLIETYFRNNLIKRR